jgi:phenylalanyl-tRNA synthetase beta chain
VQPDAAYNYGIDNRCYIAELNLDVLYSYAKLDKKYKAIPKFPAVTRDMAILIDDNILVQEIQEIMWKQGGNMVESIKLFDVYKGEQIPQGKRSIAYSLIYRLENKTLTDEEVNKVHDKIVRTLESKLGAQLR